MSAFLAPKLRVAEGGLGEGFMTTTGLLPASEIKCTVSDDGNTTSRIDARGQRNAYL